MSNHVGLEQVSSRKLLAAVLPTASDLEAFCLDCFPDVAARFASGQNRVDRDNLLLQIADGEELVAALAKRNPRRFARYKRLLLSPRSSSDEAAKNPYRGLSAFQVEEADLFFGRDELTERLWQRFRALYEQVGSTRLLAVLGPSGSGKSSVARAGLMAELNTSPIPGPEPVRCITLTPTDKPLTALAIALLPPCHEPPTAGELSERRYLVTFLSQPSAVGELDGLSQWANQPSANTSPFVVLVDQFEEVYTLCTDTKEREAFVGLLLHAAASRGRHVSVVITLRSDFLGETHRQHPWLNRLISDQAVIVSAMSRDELRQVIAEPAEQAGQPIDDATVELLLGQAWGNEGTLPLLEFALTRIWEGMHAGQKPGETLREIGGVGGALAGKAQEIFDKLDPAEQVTAQRALVRLVRLGEGTRDTRRRASIAELCGQGETDARVLDVLREFATEQARLVTLSSNGAEPFAEVTHEALFDRWTALRTWIEQGRTDRRLYERALDAAKLWHQARKPIGRLWRPPDLDLLRDYQRRKPEDFGPLVAEFLATAQRRQKTEQLLSLGAVAAVIVALITAGAVYLLKEQQRTHEAALAKENIRQQLLDSYIERGRQLVFERGKPNEGLLWLHRAQVEGSRDASLRTLLASALRATGAAKTALIGHRSAVSSTAYSPDGRYIVTASTDKMARVWEAESGHLLAELTGHRDSVLSAIYSPDGRRIVTASADRIARVWESNTGRLISELKGHNASIISAMFSPDGHCIATASWDNTARVWEAESGRLLLELRGHGSGINSVTYSPDGRHIVTASADKTACVWDAMSGRLLAALNGHSDSVLSATFSPDGRHIVTASWDHTAREWEADSGRPLAELRGHKDSVLSATYSPDGQRILTASLDHTAREWEAGSGRSLNGLTGHEDSVLSATYSPDSKYIVTASSDHTARVWKSNSAQLIVALHGHADSVLSAKYDPAGRRILTASADHTARVWVAESEYMLATLNRHRDSVLNAQYSPDGFHILTASKDHIARIWEADSGRLLGELNGLRGPVFTALYSPDGRFILTAALSGIARVWESDSRRMVAEIRAYPGLLLSATYHPDGRHILTTGWEAARVWEANSGRLLRQLRGDGKIVATAMYSPDGRHIVTADDNTARVWEADNGRQLTQLKGHWKRVVSATYSPDGRYILTASQDKSARVWEANSGRLLIQLWGHRDSLNSATYSPDGRRIVTTSDDRTARVWAVDSGSLLAELKGHGDSISTATFSPDGHRIVTASEDMTVCVWEAHSGRLLAELKGHEGGINGATYSPDGRHIVTASTDKTARVWDISPDARTPEQLAVFIRCHVPVKFDPTNKSVLIPHLPTAEDCPEGAPLH